MKRLILLISLALLAMLLAGCGVAGSGTSEQSNIDNTDNSIQETASQQTGTTLQGCAGLVVAGSCNVIQDANGEAAAESLPLAIAGVCANGWIALIFLLGTVVVIGMFGDRN